MRQRIPMLHPETGETVLVSDKAADELIDRGYELADEPKPEPKSKTSKPKPESE